MSGDDFRKSQHQRNMKVISPKKYETDNAGIMFAQMFTSAHFYLCSAFAFYRVFFSLFQLSEMDYQVAPKVN